MPGRGAQVPLAFGYSTTPLRGWQQLPVFAGKLAVRGRAQPRLRASKDPADNQPTAPLTTMANATAIPGPTGLDWSDQSRHRCALYTENLEPDHAQNRSRRR